MATITFRSDPETDRALAHLTAGGIDRSKAIRDAILTADRVRVAEDLRAQARALAADDADRAEARAIMEDLADLRAW